MAQKTATKNGSSKAELARLLKNVVEEKEFSDVGVERKGDRIVIPEGMQYEQAHTWLNRAEESEESITSIRHEIECYPLDGAIALSKALKRLYGFTHLQGHMGMFGRQKPKLITIPAGANERTEVVWGEFSVPGMEGGTLGTSMDLHSGNPAFVISGEVKRKFKSAVHTIISEVEKIVRNESIYKGKAIRVNLDYNHFDPIKDAPKFMDLSNVNTDDLILNKQTEYELTVSIWSRIQQSEAIAKNGVPLKHGALLSGAYGTGKTMSARMTAKKAEDNGWTFIYLEDSSHLANAIRLADTYAPAVLFAEDVDKAVEGSDRTSDINKILNTLDGVDTKDNRIITVLTTNHSENINSAFLRAGRIDSIIEMESPDNETIQRFIEYYGGDIIHDEADLEKAAKSMEGFVAAFINEAVNKAKMYAISREGANIKGKVTTDDLIGAGNALTAHIERTKMKKQLTDEEKAANNWSELFRYGYDNY